MPGSPVRILVVLLLYCTIPLACPMASASATAPQQPPDAIPNSAAGLQDQLETILNAARNHEAARYDSLVSSLRIPEGTQWFDNLRGDRWGACGVKFCADLGDLREPSLVDSSGDRGYTTAAGRRQDL